MTRTVEREVASMPSTMATLYIDVRVASGAPGADTVLRLAGELGPDTVLRLAGELGPDTVAELGGELAALIRAGHHRLCVDLGRLSGLSPVCVGVLNCAASAVRACGGSLTIAGLSPADASRLRAAGLHPSIAVHQRLLEPAGS